jgi:hypothetical protein
MLSGLPSGRKYRQLSAVLTSVVGCFVTVAYLSPIFTTSSSTAGTRTYHHHQHYYGSSSSSSSSSITSSSSGGGGGLVHASLLLLAFNATLVGAALGSLLPRAASGATLGYSVTLLGEALLFGFCSWVDGGPSDSSMTTANGGGIALYYQFVGPTVAMVGGMITARYVCSIIHNGLRRDAYVSRIVGVMNHSNQIYPPLIHMSDDFALLSFYIHSHTHFFNPKNIFIEPNKTNANVKIGVTIQLSTHSARLLTMVR